MPACITHITLLLMEITWITRIRLRLAKFISKPNKVKKTVSPHITDPLARESFQNASIKPFSIMVKTLTHKLLTYYIFITKMNEFLGHVMNEANSSAALGTET